MKIFRRVIRAFFVDDGAPSIFGGLIPHHRDGGDWNRRADAKSHARSDFVTLSQAKRQGETR